jgi:hypothetical protein
VGLKISCKIAKKNPKLLTHLTISISQSNVLHLSKQQSHLSKQGISLPSILFDLYFIGYFILCVSLIFFFFSQFFFFWFFILSQFFFILSQFFFSSFSSLSHIYIYIPNRTQFFFSLSIFLFLFYSFFFFFLNRIQFFFSFLFFLIQTEITDIIGLESESVFLFLVFFPILDVVYFFPLY